MSDWCSESSDDFVAADPLHADVYGGYPLVLHATRLRNIESVFDAYRITPTT